MPDLAVFSRDYATARRRFRSAAAQRGWRLETFPIAPAETKAAESGAAESGAAESKAAESKAAAEWAEELADLQLTVDVAISPAEPTDKCLVVSSGVHGIEGFLGSAVQLSLLEGSATSLPSDVRYVLVHALNPFGFAHLRRFDQDNVDLNRNLLLPTEAYAGAPAGYAELDSLLNPRRPPSRWEPFILKALWTIARQGMPVLRQAVAAGQYEFPQGLFFGGAGRTASHRLLAENLGRWLQQARDVVHLDIHTGLGAWSTCKLLSDHPLSETQRRRLTDWFGPTSFEASDSRGTAYRARGSFGQWCVGQSLAADYLYACVEFGTYSPLQVVTGLRAENQAHHWGTPAAASTRRAKQRLQELFCPASPAWRAQTLEHSLTLVTRAAQGLAQATPQQP